MASLSSLPTIVQSISSTLKDEGCGVPICALTSMVPSRCCKPFRSQVNAAVAGKLGLLKDIEHLGALRAAEIGADDYAPGIGNDVGALAAAVDVHVQRTSP